MIQSDIIKPINKVLDSLIMEKNIGYFTTIIHIHYIKESKLVHEVYEHSNEFRLESYIDDVRNIESMMLTIIGYDVNGFILRIESLENKKRLNEVFCCLNEIEYLRKNNTKTHYTSFEEIKYLNNKYSLIINPRILPNDYWSKDLTNHLFPNHKHLIFKYEKDYFRKI